PPPPWHSLGTSLRDAWLTPSQLFAPQWIRVKQIVALLQHVPRLGEGGDPRPFERSRLPASGNLRTSAPLEASARDSKQVCAPLETRLATVSNLKFQICNPPLIASQFAIFLILHFHFAISAPGRKGLYLRSSTRPY